MIKNSLEFNQEVFALKVLEPRNVKPYNQNQMELFPPSVQNLIEDDHLCMVVNDNTHRNFQFPEDRFFRNPPGDSFIFR